jgi:predicted lactoylglutathione lyase
MTTSRSRKIFVNLPVRNLDKSIEFFTRLGFAFNPQFTDHTGTCMIISEEAYVMLLTEAKFKEFAKKEICDTATCNEGLFCLSSDSRAEVDALLQSVVAAGGKEAGPPMDHGFMYLRDFHDLDGHHWSTCYVDMKAVPPHPQKA